MNSEEKKHNNGLLTRNTIALYLRTALMLVINLYTSRVILRVLGVDDFAIYSIIGNFVATFTIITSTLTLASQRFITYEIGRGNEADIRRTFSTALSLHLIMAVLVVINHCANQDFFDFSRASAINGSVRLATSS